MLGDVRGRDVLELGCGAAQWSIALRADGARRRRARRLDRATASRARRRDGALPLVLASGERLPFVRRRFDIVFCDHGALSFCDPDVILAECARVLRPGGLLAFCATHPLLYLTWDDEEQRQTRRLQIEYARARPDGARRGHHRLGACRPARGSACCARTASTIEDCIELCAPERRDHDVRRVRAAPKWARRWPAEWIWKARRR